METLRLQQHCHNNTTLQEQDNLPLTFARCIYTILLSCTQIVQPCVMVTIKLICMHDDCKVVVK